MSVSDNVGIGNSERIFNFDGGSSVFRGNTSCDSGSNDRIIGNSDGSNQFWSGTNGSRCSSYAGALRWSFASDGRLVGTFGPRSVCRWCRGVTSPGELRRVPTGVRAEGD